MKKPNVHKSAVAFAFDIFHFVFIPSAIGSIIENALSIPKVNSAMKNITPKTAAAKGRSDIARLENHELARAGSS